MNSNKINQAEFFLGLAFSLILLVEISFAQSSSQQDSTLNNLVHPDGYKTCSLGDLGSVSKSGKGKQAMIFIAGLGFSGSDYASFIEEYKKHNTIYTITPAGFGNTQAPPIPADTSIKYADMNWTYAITTGILNLIEKEKLNKPIIVAHFITATQVAFNLAANYPNKISKVIILGGSPYRFYPGFKDGTWNDWENEKVLTHQQRITMPEFYWAPKWFKTVTKKTWDENMWTPEDYCKDTTLGSQLFKTSAQVPVQVMIRYLIEWMAYDADEIYAQIKVPTLILAPDFKELITPANPTDTASCISVAAKQYLKYFHAEPAWKYAKQSGNKKLQIQTIPDTRLFMWYDNPKSTYKAINKFLNAYSKPPYVGQPPVTNSKH